MWKFSTKRIATTCVLLSILMTGAGFSFDNKNKDFSKYVICIDAGHQSKGDSSTEPISPGSKLKKAKVSSGTTGISTRIPEYKFNLSIALKLQTLLRSKGFKVVMTRETNDVNISNIERAEVGNNAKADLSVRIHADGSTDKSRHGVSVLYPASLITENINGISKVAASDILKEVVYETSSKSLGVTPRTDLTGFNWTRVPSILIEAGFMTNTNEDRMLEKKDYQDKIVKGIGEGIEEFLLSKK